MQKEIVHQTFTWRQTVVIQASRPDLCVAAIFLTVFAVACFHCPRQSAAPPVKWPGPQPDGSVLHN
jgi:hypothetical protein